MKKNKLIVILLGLVYIGLFIVAAGYDLAVSGFLTAREVSAIVQIGYRFGPLPSFLVPAWCIIVLGEEWEKYRISRIIAFGLCAGGAYSVVRPDLSSLLDFLKLVLVWAFFFAVLDHLPMPERSKSNKRILTIGIIVSFGSLLTVEVMKMLWGRPRFMLVKQEEELFREWYKISGFALRPDGYRSFPSGHSVSASSIFFITYLPLLFPSLRRKQWVFWLISITFTAFVAFSRVMGGMHYISDVMAGYAVYMVWYIGGELWRTRQDADLKEAEESK